MLLEGNCMNTLESKPKVGEVVKIYCYNKKNGKVAPAPGQWDGEIWRMFLPYMKGPSQPLPVHLQVVGWEKIKVK